MYEEWNTAENGVIQLKNIGGYKVFGFGLIWKYLPNIFISKNNGAYITNGVLQQYIHCVTFTYLLNLEQ